MNTTTVKVLHTLEDGLGTITTLQNRSGLSETTVRKHLKLLEEGGFARKADDGTWSAVDKHEDTEEVNMPKTPEAKEAAAPAARAGRPRDPKAQERDDATLKLIVSGEATDKAAIASKLEITPSLAYLSIWRLQKAKLIQKTQTGSRTPAYAVLGDE